jgi:histidinol phosphatase-like PHP family hydrolase
MPVHNSDVAELFSQVADLLEIEGANPFRVRAYRDAARTIATLSENVADMVEKGKDLTELPGVGEDLAGKIQEIVRTGELGQLAEIEQRTPPELAEMMKVPGLGPKRVRALYEQLGVTSLDGLEEAAKKRKIHDLEGFGVKTEQKILEELQHQRQKEKRTRLNVAEEFVEPLAGYLRGLPGVRRVLAITDHSQHISVTGGLDADRMIRQMEEIDRLNEQLTGITLLKGIEVDILQDGSLDLPDDVLKRLDLTICAVHSHFGLSQDKQTERIIRAMDNPYFSILAHPTGRLIGEREPYDVDMERLIEAAVERGCYMEVNAHPSRLDLDDVYSKMAQEKGLKVAISTDAHSANELGYLRFGVGQARRGWLEAKDVLNTKSRRELKKLLKRT